MDLVTDGASYGVFIPLCNTVTRNNYMGSAWNKAAIRPQKHAECPTMKQGIYKPLCHTNIFPK